MLLPGLPFAGGGTPTRRGHEEPESQDARNVAPGEVAAALLAEGSLQRAEETGSAAVGERKARRRSSRVERAPAVRCGVSDDELDCPGAALSAEVPLMGAAERGRAAGGAHGARWRG